jgi:hypothetical protein
MYIFKSEKPEFLLGPDNSKLFGVQKSWCMEEGRQFLEELRNHDAGIDYPYLALLYDNDALCFIMPDSPHLGGGRGGLRHWSEEYDASTHDGLARMIHEELSRPVSIFKHSNPITCVVDFTGTQELNPAYRILAGRYGHDVHGPIYIPRLVHLPK